MGLPVAPTKFNHFESEFLKTLNQLLKDAPRELRKSILYTCKLPGKRLRPRLCLESAALLRVRTHSSGKLTPALTVAIALEMIHVFSLIHDDLPCMDDDDFRRGKPSNHKKFGEATALLAGDALYGMALSLLSEIKPSSVAQSLTTSLHCYAGPIGMIGGQALEMQLLKKPSLSLLHKVHRAKTGCLIEASLLLPLKLARGVTSNQKRALEQFAISLGNAFQIADDLEDPPQKNYVASHILHYMSRKKASQAAYRDLEHSTKALDRVFKGGRASSLVKISQEILKRLG